MGKPPILIVYASDIVGLGNRDRLITLSQIWHEKGHAVSILMPESMSDEFSEFIKGRGLPIKILTIPHTKAIKKFSFFRMIFAYLSRLLFGSLMTIPEDIGIAYSLTGIITEILPAFVLKLKRPQLKWIALIDNLVYGPTDKRRKQKFLIKLIAFSGFLLTVKMCRRADIILTVNDTVKKGLAKMGIPEGKILYTANGIMLDALSDTLPDAGSSKRKRFDGVFLGRLDHSKGILSLIDIWRELCDLVESDLKLAVIGKGTDNMEKEINQKIRENRLEDKVILLGYLKGQAKNEVLRESKLFVFPSIDESWGIVLMEALAAGLPVVAYDLDAYKSIYPDSIITRVPIGDTKQFLFAIKSILMSRDIMKNAGERIEFAENFAWDDVVKKEYARIINKI